MTLLSESGACMARWSIAVKSSSTARSTARERGCADDGHAADTDAAEGDADSWPGILWTTGTISVEAMELA